jgi:hypothetical protein
MWGSVNRAPAAGSAEQGSMKLQPVPQFLVLPTVVLLQRPSYGSLTPALVPPPASLPGPSWVTPVHGTAEAYGSVLGIQEVDALLVCWCIALWAVDGQGLCHGDLEGGVVGHARHSTRTYGCCPSTINQHPHVGVFLVAVTAPSYFIPNLAIRIAACYGAP